MSAHVDVAQRAPEAILDHPVDHLLIAELHAVAHAIYVVRRIRHRLLSTGDHNLPVAGLEPGSADLLDGHRGYCRRNSRLDRSLTRGRLSDAALDDVAEDDLLDVVD